MLSKNQLREIQALHQQKQRQLSQQFIAEGIKTVVEIIEQRKDIIVKLFAVQEFLDEFQTLLSKQAITGIAITPEELKKISLQSSPQQVVAVCSYFKPQSAVKASGMAFYLDDIRDPGNLGTIIRLSDWFGMPNLYCSENTCDHYNPKVVQSSMGSFLRVTLHYCPLQSLLEKFPVRYGAVLEGVDVFSVPLQKGLLIIGNEAHGISEANLALITTAVKIPAAQNSSAESLNAAMAASILAAESFRQVR